MARNRYQRDYSNTSDSYANSRRSRALGRGRYDSDDDYYYDDTAQAYSPNEYTDEPYYDEYSDTDSGYDNYNEGYEDYDSENYYDDEGYENYDDGSYEDYGELAPEDEADYEYNNYGDRSSRRTLPSNVGRSYTRMPPARSNRFQTQDDKDIEKYLDYLERYDTGEIDNYEMSRIQRAYAKKPFWRTFQPSRDLIKKYGSGDESTHWPMFRREGSRWVPEVWRND